MSQQLFGWFRNKYQTPGGTSFTPTVNIEEGIQKFIHWYKQIHSK